MRVLNTCGALLFFASTFVLHSQSGAAAREQTAAPQLPAFEVASIKPFLSGEMRIGIHQTDDGITMTGMPMHMIVREAFGVTNDRLLGEPGWVGTSRFDVEAKVAPEDASKLKQLSQEQRWAMLVPVLEDRCALKFHHETRDLTVYTLVVAKGGPKLQLSEPAGAAAKQTAPESKAQNKAQSKAWIGDFSMGGRSASMATIARMLSLQLGSTVVDKTGLTGTYDYTLQFAPENNVGLPMRPRDGSDSPVPESQGPSIFTAVQEQLGLKLEAQTMPVDVVVIDHIEQPSAN
jgi:uncharacterized protein (TIGR03435 family)